MSEITATPIYVCGTCPHFSARKGLIAAPGMRYDGLCFGQPPLPMLMALPLPPQTIEQIGKPGAEIITCQSQRPPVGEQDQGCHLHPEYQALRAEVRQDQLVELYRSLIKDRKDSG